VSLVPRPLLPRWRDLPRLAWVAADRFAGTAARVPVFGRLCVWAAWLSTLAVLVAARAERTCAGRGGVAVMMVRQRWPHRRRWVRHTAFIATLPVGAFALAAPSTLLLVASAVADSAGAHRAASVLRLAAPAAFAILVVAAIAGTASGLGAVAPRERRLARDWAQRAGVTLVEASLLAAAETDQRAATVLVRQMLRHADVHRLAVLARPLDATVADRYAVLGFRPVAGGQGRVLLRPPDPVGARLLAR